MKKLVARLSFLVPTSWLSTAYLFERIDILSADAATCDHEWHVVASILSSVELQVHCYKCNTYSEVPDPSKKEWDESYNAMENPYPWRDHSRIRYYQNERADQNFQPLSRLN
ncbi:hypothetical protein GCM10007385_26760 [Tateyamaria omphalii]|nr:hypothetical protein GCM10007385_26760 [Tateyamaria omphalii]